MQSENSKIFYTAFANWLQIILLIISNVLLVPLILTKWEPNLLGLWFILISLTQFSFIINLSHQSYLYNRSFVLNRNKKKLINQELISALPLSLIISLFVIVVFYISYKFNILSNLLNIDEKYSKVLNISIIYISILNFFTYSYSNFFSGPFSAFGYYHIYALIKVFRAATTLLIPAYSIFRGATFIEAVYVLIFTEILSFFVHIFFSIKYFKKLSFKIYKPNFVLALKQLYLSFYILINYLIDFIKANGLRLILASIFSPLIVSYFVTLRIISNFIKFSIDSLRDPLFPKLMSSFKNNKRNVIVLIEIYWIISIAILSPILVLIQFLIPELFEMWTLNKIEFQPILFSFLLMSLLFYSIYLPFDMILKGFNQNKTLLRINIVTIFIFLASLLVFHKFYSLIFIGIAIFLLEVITSIFFYTYLKNFLKHKKININKNFFYITNILNAHTCILLFLISVKELNNFFMIYIILIFTIIILFIPKFCSNETFKLIKKNLKY